MACHLPLRLGAVILALSAAWAVEAPAHAPALPTAAAVRLHTDREVLERWFPACLDPDGGFHPAFARDWSRKPADTISLVFSARMVWFAAAVAQHRPALRERYAAVAQRGARWLMERYWDAAHGGLRWEIAGDRAPRGGEKHLYGMAFAIFALASVHQATGDIQALADARRIFDWIEAHAHDAANRGWHEALDAAGRPLPPDPPGVDGDRIGTRRGFKSMNTHLHLLEALTALARSDHAPLVRERLKEAVAVLAGPLWAEPGCLHLYASPDWRPLPDGDSFGHDLEAAYLLDEACTVLGVDDPQLRRQQRALVDHALDYGQDPQGGGIFDLGSGFRPAVDRRHVWWAQAEAVGGLLLMERRHGGETPRYREALARVWRFIATRQVDPLHGGWFWDAAGPDGAPPAMDDKGGNWQEAYHQARALFALEDRLGGN